MNYEVHSFSILDAELKEEEEIKFDLLLTETFQSKNCS